MLKLKFSDLFVILLTGLYEDIADQFLLNYLSAQIFYHHISYENVTKELMGNCKITNKTIVNNMWYDATYGFKDFNTFNVYMRINFLGKTNIKKYLTGYFNITKKQMECITGRQRPNALINGNVNRYKNDLNETYYESFCKLHPEIGDKKNNCTESDYAIIEFGTGAITRLVDKPNYVRSYKDLNLSLLFDYEVNTYNRTIDFELETAAKLLSVAKDGQESDNPHSLLNFSNAAFLDANQDNIPAIAARFDINATEASVLITFYQKTMLNFAQLTKNPKLDYYKSRFSRDAIQQSIDWLKLYTLNNITMKAFNDVYTDKKKQILCREYFNKYGDAICNSNLLSLDNYEGVVIWVIALFNNSDGLEPTFDALKTIETALGLNSTDEVFSILDGSYFNITFWQIQLKFQDEFGCFSPPCARKFLAEKQFYTGNITNVPNLTQMYPSLTKRSVASFPENKDLLKNKIPEMFGFYNIHYDFGGSKLIFGGETDVIFSNNQGSVENYYQVMLMYDFSRSARTSDIAHLFNIWSPPEYFVAYMDHLFFEWYLGGLIKEQKASNLLNGTEDATLKMLVGFFRKCYKILNFFVL